MSNDTEHDYWTSVRATAEEIAAACRAGEVDDIHDRLHEDCDGSYWVIYCHAARACLLHSPNEDAGPDELGWDDFASGADSMSALRSRAAFYAFRADVLDALGSVIRDAVGGVL